MRRRKGKGTVDRGRYFVSSNKFKRVLVFRRLFFLSTSGGRGKSRETQGDEVEGLRGRVTPDQRWDGARPISLSVGDPRTDNRRN